MLRSAFTHCPIAGYVVVGHALATETNWNDSWGADLHREDT